MPVCASQENLNLLTKKLEKPQAGNEKKMKSRRNASLCVVPKQITINLLPYRYPLLSIANNDIFQYGRIGSHFHFQFNKAPQSTTK